MDVLLFIIKNNLKNIFSVRNVILFVLYIIAIFICLPYIEISVKIQLIMGFFPLILIVICSRDLAKEFESGAYKYIFTGKLHRSYIILFKNISIIVIAIILGVVFSVLAFMKDFSNGIELSISMFFTQLLKIELVFISFTMFISSVASFITILSKNFVYTLLVLYIMFFDTFRNILETVAIRTKMDFLKKILFQSPFLEALKGFQNCYYPTKVIVIMISTSLILSLLDCIIIEKIDL